MKKTLFLLLCCTVFVIGCGKKQSENAQDENFSTTAKQEASADKPADAVVDHSVAIAAIDNMGEEEIQKDFDDDLKVMPAKEKELFVMGYKADKKVEQKFYKEAIDDYTKILAIKENAWTYGRRGAAKKASGDFEGAMADFNKAVSFGNPVSWIYAERADLKVRLGDKQGAIADYESSLKDEEAWKYEKIAELKRELGDNAGADAALKKAKGLSK